MPKNLSLRRMKTVISKLVRMIALGIVLSILISSTTFAQGSGPRFPRSHAERLGGASYAALFGHTASALTPGPIAAPGGGLLPIVGPNIQINTPQQPFPNGLLGRSETTIGSNSTGQFLVAGWNDAEGFCGPPFNVPCTPPPVPGLSGYGYSSNNGQTWTDGGAPPTFGGAISRGDPWIDSNGSTFYFANLSVNAAGDDLGVSVHRGSFSGSSFAWTDVRVFNSPNAPDDFYDKEAIVVGKKSNLGRAYVSLTNFIEICGQPQFGFGQIEVWRTTNGGNTWLGPVIAGPEAPDSVASCGNEGTLQQSSVPAIGPNGEVYVAWQFGPTFDAAGNPSTDADIVVARSLNGGVSFQPRVKVADINSMRQNPPVGYNRNRINDHPRMDVASAGPFKGRVFVVFASAVQPVATPPSQQSLVSSQVYISYSTNKGQSWSAPSAVAPPVPPTGLKRFWPVVTVTPGGEKIDVVYYESQEKDIGTSCNRGGRTGPAVSLVDTYRVQSLNGGTTWSAPVRVSSATSNWCTTASNIVPNFGDYIGSVSPPNQTHPVWADGRNGVPDVFTAIVVGSDR